MSLRSIEKRLDDLERALDARPIIFVVSCKPLSPDNWRSAIAAARRKAGVAPGALAVEYNVCTGVGLD